MDPVVQRIVAIVTAIGPLSNDVVFVGGAIAPLLHTDHAAPPARPTKDVDALIESRTYADGERHADILRRRGFAHVIERQAHAHRWRSPDGVLFDLVPVGRHAGGTGNEWDARALETATTTVVAGVSIRHASAAAFIAMKLEAFKDRGSGDLRASHDMEDIVALIASRASIAEDIDDASPAVRDRVRDFSRSLLDSGFAEELLAGHLNNADDTRGALDRALARLSAIAAVR